MPFHFMSCKMFLKLFFYLKHLQPIVYPVAMKFKLTLFPLKLVLFLSLNIWYVCCTLLWIKYEVYGICESLHSDFIYISHVITFFGLEILKAAHWVKKNLHALVKHKDQSSTSLGFEQERILSWTTLSLFTLSKMLARRINIHSFWPALWDQPCLRITAKENKKHFWCLVGWSATCSSWFLSNVYLLHLLCISLRQELELHRSSLSACTRGVYARTCFALIFLKSVSLLFLTVPCQNPSI